MSVIVVNIFCALLIVGGIALAVRGAGGFHGRARLNNRPDEAPRPAAYAARIAGVMMAAFGLALGALVTAFSIANG